MKKVFSLLKRAGKAYCKAYMNANTVKMSDGRIAFISGVTGTVYVA